MRYLTGLAAASMTLSASAFAIVGPASTGVTRSAGFSMADVDAPAATTAPAEPAAPADGVETITGRGQAKPDIVTKPGAHKPGGTAAKPATAPKKTGAASNGPGKAASGPSKSMQPSHPAPKPAPHGPSAGPAHNSPGPPHSSAAPSHASSSSGPGHSNTSGPGHSNANTGPGKSKTPASKSAPGKNVSPPPGAIKSHAYIEDAVPQAPINDGAVTNTKPDAGNDADLKHKQGDIGPAPVPGSPPPASPLPQEKAQKPTV